MTMRRTVFALGLVPVLLPLASVPAVAQATEFTVRIENVSTPETLKLSNGKTAPAPTSPGVWAVYRGVGNPIFRRGAYVEVDGLEPQAEEGSPERLVAALGTRQGVQASGAFAIPLGDREAGPLLPGKVYEFRFTATPGSKLVLAMMFGQSNDLFYAPGNGGIALFDGRGRPIGGDITDRLTLWDAGTEVNEEPGLGANQAPRQPSPNTGAPERTRIRQVRDSFTYPATAGVVRVTITPAQMASR
jgi:hypothetical protein